MTNRKLAVLATGLITTSVACGGEEMAGSSESGTTQSSVENPVRLVPQGEPRTLELPNDGEIRAIMDTTLVAEILPAVPQVEDALVFNNGVVAIPNLGSGIDNPFYIPDPTEDPVPNPGPGEIPNPDEFDCTASLSCGEQRVCRLDEPTRGQCVFTSSVDCDDAGVCINGVSLTVNDEGEFGGAPVCTSSCPTVDGHLESACVDVDGSQRVCVPVCQFHDDPSRMNCVLDVSKEIDYDCSREHAMLRSVASAVLGCSAQRIQSSSCRAPMAQLDADERGTMTCILQRMEGSQLRCSELVSEDSSGCFSDTNPMAPLSIDDMMDAVERNLDLDVVSASDAP